MSVNHGGNSFYVYVQAFQCNDGRFKVYTVVDLSNSGGLSTGSKWTEFRLRFCDVFGGGMRA